MTAPVGPLALALRKLDASRRTVGIVALILAIALAVGLSLLVL